MLFSKITSICIQLENESSRLKKKDILNIIFINESINDTKKIIYFICSLINNNDNTLYINEMQIINYISEYYLIDKKKLIIEIKKYGDIGLFIQQYNFNKNLNKITITIDDVVILLENLKNINGKNSIEQKKILLFQLWDNLLPNDISYLIKFITNKLRIGITHKTILDLLYNILTEDNRIPFPKNFLEKQYGICNDIGYIAENVLSKNINAIYNINPILGNYIQSQSAEVYFKDKINIEYKSDGLITQPKLDGFRLQAHIFSNKIILFSRNGIEITNMYPDVVSSLLDFKIKNNIENIILDGEIIGFNFENQSFLEFEEVAKRKRRYNIENNSSLCQLQYIIFDLLYYNNTTYIDYQYEKRLSQLDLFNYSNYIKLIESYIIHNNEELEKIYKEIGSQYEGIMIKSNQSFYQPGKRTRSWLKYKNVQKDSLEDNIDLVILGYTLAKGNKKIRQKIGSLLVGHYNENKNIFETVAQVGGGGDTILWNEIEDIINKYTLLEAPSNVIINKAHFPDFYILPEIIISIKADKITKSKEHTSGWSVRFPRLIKIRKDKNKYQTHIPGT